MERTLLWSAFGVGLLGWLCTLLLNRPARQESGGISLSRSYLLAALVIPLLVWLATLPSRPPFAPGHGLGDGFLIGAAGALLSAWVLLRATKVGAAGRANEGSSAAAATAPLFLGVTAASIATLWLQENLLDALLGVGIGWFVVSFLLIVGLMGQGRAGRSVALAITAGVGFIVSLAMLSALGDFREDVRFASGALPVSWSAIGLAFSALIPFLILLCALPASFFAQSAARLPGAGLLVRLFQPLIQDDEAGKSVGRGLLLLVGAILLLGGSRLFASRIESHPNLVILTVLGLFATLIAWWLTASPATDAAENPAFLPIKRWQNLALAAFALLAGAMAAYQLMAGFGLGIMLLAAWFVGGYAVAIDLARVLPAEAAPAAARQSAGGERTSQLLTLLLFAVVLAVYRLFMVRFDDDLRGVSLTDHYALFGFLVGALLPVMLTGFLLAPPSGRDRASLPGIGRIVVTGIIVLAVPALVLILFGAKCAMALFFGLAFATILSAPPAATAASGEEPVPVMPGLPILVALFALAVALALGQWTDHVLPFSLYDRAQKIRVIGYVVGALIALILLADYGDRLQTWLRGRRESATADAKGAVK